MSEDTTDKPGLAAYLAVGAGLLTAFGCGMFLSEPVDRFEAEYEQSQSDTPTVVPTAYQTIQNGRVGPEQIGPSRSGKPGFMGPPPEIVLKLKDADKAKQICDMFWKDKVGARKAFDDVIKGDPKLEGLTLKRVTYSNEFVVDFGENFPGSRDELTRKFVDAVKSLENMPNISYAEPNATAQPGR